MNKHSLLDRLCVCTFVEDKKMLHKHTYTRARKVLQHQYRYMYIYDPCTGTTVCLRIHGCLSKSNMCWYKYV